MKAIRRGVLALAGVVTMTTAVLTTPTDAAPPMAARELIPCLYSAAPAIHFGAGTTTVIDTTAMTIGGGSPTGVVVDDVAVFTFDSISIDAAATVTVQGTRPLALLSRSTIVNNGILRVVPGNAGGGSGGALNAAGSGPGGGTAGGGGGGFGGIGGQSGSGATGGVVYGNLLENLQGGSGGGGSSDEPGGGGGGAVALVALTSITVPTGGLIVADGADALSGAGGGSGGAIVLRAPTVNAAGSSLDIRGGDGGVGNGSSLFGGGGGGGGRLLFSGNAGTVGFMLTGGAAGGITPSGVAAGTAGADGDVDGSGLKLKQVQSFPALVRSSVNWDLNPLVGSSPAFAPAEFTYGVKPLAPFMGDWDGDGTKTAGYYNAGVFHLRDTNANSSAETTVSFGDARGFPVVGDWNGDGLDDIGTYLNGVWKLRTTGCGEPTTFSFGTGNWPATVPVAGDWNGDGISGIGTYALASGVWTIRDTPAGTNTTIAFPGANNHYPVVGDWNADGVDTIGVKATTSANWSLRDSNTAGAPTYAFTYGLSNDLPLAHSILAPSSNP